MKYNAFISYSHIADGLLSSKIQLGLQKVAKPWYKIRALNIYRDQTNLSVTPDLWGTIQNALYNTEYIILMASPTAAKSKWVNKEIIFWLKNRSLDTIIIAITEGDLVWNDEQNAFDFKASDAVPEILLRAYTEEPLYVDFRNFRTQIDLSLNNPSFKEKIISVAARLHNKSVIDMLSDEVTEHRKTIRLRNSAILILCILLLTSISLFIYSLQQTKNAERERDIAVSRELTLSAEKNISHDPQLSLILGVYAAEKLYNISHELSSDSRSFLQRVIKANYRKLPVLFGENGFGSGGVEAFAVSPDGKKMAIGSSGNVVKVISTDSLNVLFEVSQDWTVSIAWSSDNKYFATSGQVDKTANIWDAQTGRNIKQFKYENTGGIMDVAWRPNTHVLAFALANGGSSMVKVYDLDKDTMLFEVPGIRVSWSPNADKIATGGLHDWVLLVYDHNGNFICKLPGNNQYVHDIAWNSDNSTVAAVSVDDQLNILDVKSCHEIEKKKIEFPLSVAWSPDKRFLAVGGGSNNVKIFDVIDHYKLVDSVDYTTTITGDVVSGSDIKGYVLKIAWTKDGKELIIGDREGSITYVNMDLLYNNSDTALVTVAKSLITRKLSKKEMKEYLHTQ
jgi:WD40 repeat protein